MGHHRWAEGEETVIVQQYQGGVSIPKLSVAHGVCKPTIRKVLRRHGVYRVQFAKQLNEDQRQQIIAAYQAGASVPVLSQQWKTAENNLYRLLEYAGIKRDLARYGQGKSFYIPKHKFDDATEQEIATAYAKGVHTGPLSRQHGCSKGTILEVVKRHGIPRKNRGGLPFVWDPAIAEEIVMRYQAGESMQKLGWAFNLTNFRIAQLLRMKGIVKVGAHARGARHGSWKGGKTASHGGYISILLQPDDPYYGMVRAGGYVFEHRLNLAKKLGRLLLPQEEPHHKNGVKSDNNPSNLELWYVQRKGQRVEDLIDYVVTHHREAVTRRLNK